MWIDIFIKVMCGMLAVFFLSMAIITIIVVIREGMAERRNHGRQH